MSTTKTNDTRQQINSASSAASLYNRGKFSTVNINNQFKGKSVEIQPKTTIRTQHGGLQTLGKVVAARRMPPPANLPSMKSEHLVGDTANVNIVPQNQTGWSTTATEASNLNKPSAALTASPNQHDPLEPHGERDNHQRQTTWNSNSHSTPTDLTQNNEFPKLNQVLGASQSLQQRQQQPRQQPDNLSKESTDLVLKPANVGNWGSIRAPGTTDKTTYNINVSTTPPPQPISEPEPIVSPSATPQMAPLNGSHFAAQQYQSRPPRQQQPQFQQNNSNRFRNNQPPSYYTKRELNQNNADSQQIQQITNTRNKDYFDEAVRNRHDSDNTWSKPDFE
jgi:hypothetical protein